MNPPCVIVPLYIYPLEKAWEPLFRAARAQPRVQFLAIVNPNNGPGQDALPDASYKVVLQDLAKLPNIRPLGYVHCRYGQRPAADIRKEIDTYREWNRGYRLEGIFIDEAPSDTTLVAYMASLADHVRSSWQAAGLGRHGLVVYNPGVVVDGAFFDNADFVVTFEQSWAHWNLLQSAAAAKGVSQLAPDLSPKALAIIHTFSEACSGELERIVEDIRSMGFAGLYITEQEGGGFTFWPETWDRCVAAVGSNKLGCS
ncbi:Spherulin-like protein [Hapsidospora chrysogenum ATCC 11550]|uniref:Spherulin-like protein n=1 Tax=Hapsidospora chrysogenum (strain ATCC 11550 / CBS 779.69 / DSM 880 / IAM 14645 / JCM 23072 / IMI 49137) TaxID=857340 RepID=A0A086TBW2_HAPC1|nr:Spherulin-like protein [Hapsidospora chrysogenum ATCC 11550]